MSGPLSESSFLSALSKYTVAAGVVFTHLMLSVVSEGRACVPEAV